MLHHERTRHKVLDRLSAMSGAKPARSRGDRAATPSDVEGPTGQWSPIAMTSDARRLPNFVALSTLALVPLLLFRLHILGLATFIGNPDRLNSFLNVLKFHVDSLARGRLDAWDEYMFMGFNTFGLPYTFPNPLVYLTAAAGHTQVIRTAGFISCVLLILAGWSSYAFIRDTCKDSFFALVGAVLYQCSALTILKVSQNDMSFAVFILIPLMMLILRRTRPGNAAPCFAALAVLFAAMLTFTFLQKAAYAVMLGGAYALYRGLWLRDWRPAAIYLAALVTGLVASLPRLYGVAEELLSFTREAVGHDVSNFEALYEFQNIRPRELLRWFYDGIFGRFPEEALRLGNNINLTEGMLLYSSAIAAFLVLFALARYRGGWFRMLRFRDEDVSFHALFAAVCFAVVLIKPAQELLHALFLSIDFTHARILIAAQLSLCTLTALALQDLAGGQADEPRPGVHWRSHLAGMAIAGAVLLAITKLAGPGTLNHRVLLEQPLHRLAVASANALAYYPPDNVPRVPTRIGVTRLSTGSAEITWRDVGGEDRYEVQVRLAAGGFSTIQVSSADTTAVRLDNLMAGIPHAFRIRACYRAKCSPFSALVLLPEAITDPSPRAADEQRPFAVTWLPGSSVRWVEWLFVVFVLCTGPLRLLSQGNALRPVILACLAFLMIFEAFIGADFRVNGDHTRSAAIPFRSGNSLMARPAEYRAPERDALQAFTDALDTPRFRTVLVCNPEAFPSFCAPYLSQFWRLRMVEGYTSGLPGRLAGLPWPKGVRSLRAISFPFVDTLHWPLLSLLNVKYAIAVNEAFYRNHVSQPHGGRRDAMPGDVPIMQNPLPVVPRQFFAARTIPASRPTEAVLAVFPPGSDGIPIDPTRQSVVEGLGGERAFATGGFIEASYKGDRIDIAIDPSTDRRFLVLNEAYDPRWHAYGDGRELQVYPTNVVMRGIEVPPGVASITFQFTPFVRSTAALWLFGAAVALLGLGFVIFRRLDRPGVAPAVTS